jgi:hypothetical protein
MWAAGRLGLRALEGGPGLVLISNDSGSNSKSLPVAFVGKGRLRCPPRGGPTGPAGRLCRPYLSPFQHGMCCCATEVPGPTARGRSKPIDASGEQSEPLATSHTAERRPAADGPSRSPGRAAGERTSTKPRRYRTHLRAPAGRRGDPKPGRLVGSLGTLGSAQPTMRPAWNRDCYPLGLGYELTLIMPRRRRRSRKDCLHAYSTSRRSTRTGPTAVIRVTYQDSLHGLRLWV